MTSVAKSFIWWPGLTKSDIGSGQSSTSCQVVRNCPAVARVQPWTWPNQPWKRIYLDFVGPFQGHMFHVAVDVHFKWPEMFIMKEATATKTIENLRVIFATFTGASCYGQWSTICIRRFLPVPEIQWMCSISFSFKPAGRAVYSVSQDGTQINC